MERLMPGGDADVTKQERIMTLPAVYADRFNVQSSPEVTRITFAEAFATGTDHYRMAVVLTTENALILANLLVELIQKPRPSPPIETSAGNGE
jgi:hypothetical protein